MKNPHTPSTGQLSLRMYLTVSFVIMIIGVAGFLAAVSYMSTRDEIISQNENLRQYSERNVLESVRLVDTGLRLYDNTLNSQMKEAFGMYLDAYNASGGDPSRIDLEKLKLALQPQFQGELDLYVINESGVITSSTVPEVMGLDFRQFPDYYGAITKIRLGNAFGADRVVRSIPSAGSPDVNGTLRKFAYMPVPDHRVLLEMGLESGAFFSERTDLSYGEIARRTEDLNPNLVSVRIVDMNRMLVSAPVAANTTRIDDPGIERAMRERSGYTVPDPANGTVKSFLFADLRDPGTASDMSLVIELTYSDAILDRKLEELLLLHLLIALIAIGMGMGLAWGTTRFLTKPIEGIVEDVDEIARGELDHPIREGLTPEFTRLRESITLMISRILHFSGELERGKAELRIASAIQLSFLPKSIPEIEGFVLAAVSIPAKEVGGDFYDIIDLGPGRTGLVIADVSGKGVPAALFMVFSRTTVRASTLMLGKVAGAVASANRMISADADMGMFVTLAYGVLDAHSRCFTYANAGHNPPLHYVAATGGIRMLYPTGMLLGVDSEEIYGEETVSLASGDLLVFYTDGVTEAENSSHELFGEERLTGIVSRYAHLSPDGLIGRIREEIVSFASGAPQSDDITLMVLRAG